MHWPLEAPDEYVKLFANTTGNDHKRQMVCAMAKIMDDGIGEVLAALKSKHIDALAVDLMAYVDGARWELNLYDEIADAMAEAAREVDVPIVWGASWSVPNIAQYSEGSMEDAMNGYIDLRRSQGRRPFIDGPHFQLEV